MPSGWSRATASSPASAWRRSRCCSRRGATGCATAEFWNRAAQAAARLYAHDETAAVGAAYGRARELAREVEDPGRVIPVLIGLSAHHIVSGELRTAYDIALEMMGLFDKLGDPNLQMIGEWSLGAALFHLGELMPAHQHLEPGVELYDPAYHGARVWQTGVEPGIFCRAELSRTLMVRGFPDQSLACAPRAVADARALDHPQPLAFALLFEIFAQLGRRNPRAVQRIYEQLAVVCHAHGIAQEVHWAAPLVGRALIELGDVRRELRVLEEGLRRT